MGAAPTKRDQTLPNMGLQICSLRRRLFTLTLVHRYLKFLKCDFTDKFYNLPSRSSDLESVVVPSHYDYLSLSRHSEDKHLYPRALTRMLEIFPFVS